DSNDVLAKVASEFGGVDVVVRCHEELTDDPELAGVVYPGDHGRRELGHTIGSCDLNVGIGRAAHADAHIQPEVAVDEVVATAALDDVTTSTAQDDVAPV